MENHLIGWGDSGKEDFKIVTENTVDYENSSQTNRSRGIFEFISESRPYKSTARIIIMRTFSPFVSNMYIAENRIALLIF